MTRRWLLTFLAITLGLVAGCSSRGTPEPFWIGHLAPFTGPGRASGEQARQGIQLFIDQAVARNLKVEGRSVAVLHVNGDSSAETVRAQTARLLAVNKVLALIGSLDSGLAEKMVLEAQSFKARLVLTGEVVDSARSDSVICLGVDAATRGRALGQLPRDQGWDRIAVVSDSKSVLAGDLRSGFLREVHKDARITIDDRWTFAGPDAVTGSWPAEVAKWKPKALLLACAPRAFVQGSDALRQAGFTGPLLYGGEDAGAEALQRDGSEAPVYLATVCCTEGLTAQGLEMASKYQEKFKEKPGFAAFQAYDAIRYLVECLQQVPPPGLLRQRSRLPALETFDSLTGTVTFKDRRTSRKTFLLELKGQTSQLIRSVEPAAD